MNLNIDMNKYFADMTPFERAACHILWTDKHYSLLNKLDTLKAIALLGDGAEVTLRAVNKSKAAAAIADMRRSLGKNSPIRVVGEETYTLTVKVFDHYADPRNHDYTIIYRDQEITGKRYIYKLTWKAQDVLDWVETLASMQRVVM